MTTRLGKNAPTDHAVSVNETLIPNLAPKKCGAGAGERRPLRPDAGLLVWNTC